MSGIIPPGYSHTFIDNVSQWMEGLDPKTLMVQGAVVAGLTDVFWHQKAGIIGKMSRIGAFAFSTLSALAIGTTALTAYQEGNKQTLEQMAALAAIVGVHAIRAYRFSREKAAAAAQPRAAQPAQAPAAPVRAPNPAEIEIARQGANRVQELEGDIREFNLQIETLKQTHTRELQAQIKQLIDAKADHEEILKQMEQSLEKSYNDLAEEKHNHAGLQEKFRLLSDAAQATNQLEVAQQVKNVLADNHGEFVSLRQELQAKGDLIAKLEAGLADAEEKKADVEQQVQKQQATLDQLQETLNEKDAQLESKEAHITGLQASKKEQETIYFSTIKTMRANHKKLVKDGKELLAKQFIDSAGAYNTLHDELDELKKRTSTDPQANQDMQAELEQLKQQLAGKEEELAKLKQELAQTLDSQTEELQVLGEENQTLEGRVTDLTAELQTMKKKFDLENETTVQVQKENERLNGIIASQQEALERQVTSSSSSQSLSGEQRDIDDKIHFSEKAHETNALQKKNKELAEQLAISQNQIAVYQNQTTIIAALVAKYVSASDSTSSQVLSKIKDELNLSNGDEENPASLTTSTHFGTGQEGKKLRFDQTKKMRPVNLEPLRPSVDRTNDPKWIQEKADRLLGRYNLGDMDSFLKAAQSINKKLDFCTGKLIQLNESSELGEKSIPKADIYEDDGEVSTSDFYDMESLKAVEENSRTEGNNNAQNLNVEKAKIYFNNYAVACKSALEKLNREFLKLEVNASSESLIRSITNLLQSITETAIPAVLPSPETSTPPLQEIPSAPPPPPPPPQPSAKQKNEAGSETLVSVKPANERKGLFAQIRQGSQLKSRENQFVKRKELNTNNPAALFSDAMAMTGNPTLTFRQERATFERSIIEGFTKKQKADYKKFLTEDGKDEESAIDDKIRNYLLGCLDESDRAIYIELRLDPNSAFKQRLERLERAFINNFSPEQQEAFQAFLAEAGKEVGCPIDKDIRVYITQKMSTKENQAHSNLERAIKLSAAAQALEDSDSEEEEDPEWM